MNRLVSVILPVFNRKTIVLDTIKSILGQSYKNFELIIVDDFSTDGTYELLKKIYKNEKKIKIFKTKKNSGTCAHPRNLGISKSKGSIVCFCDSDDLWETDKLESQLKNLKNKDTIVSTAAKYFSKNYNSSISINLFRRFMQKIVFNKINRGGFQWFYLYNPLIVSSVMLHKKILENNQFDENQNTREDLDLWIRLKKKNYKFYFINKILVSIRRSSASMSSNTKKELVVIISSLCNTYLKMNNFKKLNFFLVGIFIKFLVAFLKNNAIKIKSLFKTSIVALIILIFTIFYSPLFWYLGKPLLYHDQLNLNNVNKSVVIFSGHGSTSYYNITYQYRYKDVSKILSEYDNIKNIYILGRIQEIPEQKLLESLLINDGIDRNKIKLVYRDYSNTFENIQNINKILSKDSVRNIIFVTSPYHSRRAKLFWSSISDLNVEFWKGYEWPEKNNFFEYSKNKKIILYEYMSLIYNKMRGNIN
tara:strand:- start:225 stop:1652 length:1428 start_codon:yes stop_codon:yes gene_type:complete